MVRKTVIFLLVMLTLTFACFASGTAEADDLSLLKSGQEVRKSRISFPDSKRFILI